MSARSRRVPTARDCPVCGDDMTGKPNRVQWCSRRCAGVARRARTVAAFAEIVADKWDHDKTWSAAAADHGYTLAGLERLAYRLGHTTDGAKIRRERYRLARNERLNP